jgi:hypothetical protein
MRTMLRGKITLLFMALGLLLALPAAAWADATLDTSADLSTSIVTPTNVGIGDNTFKIKVWAFQGNVPGTKNGEVNVGTKYNMSTTGVITADTTSTQKVDFSNMNYSSGCPTTGTIPQGCPGNPFEVTATLNVASGTANGKTGTLTVYHAPVTDSGLTADSVPATGQVKVVIPDSTPPVITPNVVGTLGNNGWYTSDVKLTWSVVDDESAISSQSGCGEVNVTSDQNAVEYTCTATSAGGNSSESVTIKRDATAPTGVSGLLARATADHNGWYNAPVGYSFSGSDATSLIASCSNGTYSGPDSATASIDGSCTDNAGNRTDATISGFKFDDTNPTLNPSVSPNPVLLNDTTATATPNANDATSGVASQSCPTVDTISEGDHSVNCTATDNAGNTHSADANYTVRAYTFTGFSSPVDNGGVLNVAKAGQAIPLKWRLMDNGSPVTNLSSVSGVTTNITCNLGSTDNVEVYAAGSSGLQNLGDGYYQFNWKSPTTYAKSCKTLTLKGIGMTQQANFQFTK